MKAIWSLYSVDRNYLSFSFGVQVLMLIASYSISRQHFCRTGLVTTQDIFLKIIKPLKLDFDTVSYIQKNSSEAENWWIYGKIYSYETQSEPFIHIDNDVILFDNFSGLDYSADIFTQSIEDTLRLEGYIFHPDKYIDIFKENSGYIPEDWRWCFSHGYWKMENMGIFGGNNLEFIHEYCSEVYKTINENIRVWELLNSRDHEAILLEQYILYSKIVYENIKGKGISIGRVFEEDEDPYVSEVSEKKGYCHLLGNIKNTPNVLFKVYRMLSLLEPEALRGWRMMYPNIQGVILHEGKNEQE